MPDPSVGQSDATIWSGKPPLNAIVGFGNVEAVRFQVIVQGDDGDELWEADSDFATRRPDAQRVACELLKFGRRMTTYPPSLGEREVTLTAYVYEGKMVNIGDETDEDWVFEADPTIDAEVIH